MDKKSSGFKNFEKKVETSLKKTEASIGKEAVKEEKAIKKLFRNLYFRTAMFFVLFGLIVFGILYFSMLSSSVSIDKSLISAPIITLSPSIPGVLDGVFVKEGDYVYKNMVVASVGGNSIKAEINGIIISVMNTPGQLMNSASPVVKMIDNSELRVVGKVNEAKGFSDIKLGQRVKFSVDAFPDKVYYGVIDSIGQSAIQQDIVFSISDKRATNEFEVRAKFDSSLYPELKNGMSAKMKVYK